MKGKWTLFLQQKWSQLILFTLFIVVTSSALYFSKKSVIAFLLLLSSLLILHYMNLKNLTKWIMAAALLFILIPFASSGGRLSTPIWKLQRWLVSMYRWHWD